MNYLKFLFALGYLSVVSRLSGAANVTTHSESGDDGPLFVEYDPEHMQHLAGEERRLLTPDQLQRQCAKLFEQAFKEEGIADDSYLCMPVQVADGLVNFMGAVKGDIALTSKSGKSHSLGKRLPVQDAPKSSLRAATKSAINTNEYQTYLFSDPEFKSSITGTMVVDNGQVNAVMYGDRNVTMIMPCRDVPDPKCHVAVTIKAKESKSIHDAMSTANKNETETEGMEHRHLAASAEDSIVQTIDYEYSPAAAAQLGGTTAALIQNALIRMESTNTVCQNSGMNIRYVLGEVRVASQGFTGSYQSLTYGTSTKQQHDSDYLAVIATSDELRDANGRAWQDCISLVARGIHAELYKCLVYTARLFTKDYITDAHELGHLQNGAHATGRLIDDPNFDALAFEKYDGVVSVASALSAGTESFRYPIYSQLERYFKGQPVGDPEHNNAKVIAFRARQIYQKLRNLPVDPDPIPVCEPYIALANFGKAVLNAVPGNSRANVISMIPTVVSIKPTRVPNRSAHGFKLNLVTNTGSKSIPITYNFLNHPPGSILVEQSTVPINIEFKSDQIANIYYYAKRDFGESFERRVYQLRLSGNERFVGQVKIIDPAKITSMYNIICQTGFAQDLSGSTPAPVRNPPTQRPSNPPILTQAPSSTRTKAPVITKAPSTTAPSTRSTKTPTFSAWDKMNANLVQHVKDRYEQLPSANTQRRLGLALEQFKTYLTQNEQTIGILESVLQKQPGIVLSTRFSNFSPTAVLNRYLNIVDTLAQVDEASCDKFLDALDKWKWTNRRQPPPANLMQVKKTLALALDASLEIGTPIKTQIANYFTTRSTAAKEDYKNNILWKITQTVSDADYVVKVTAAPTMKPSRRG